MFHRIFDKGFKGTALALGFTLLAGCATDSYYLVSKQDIHDLDATMTSQRSGLNTLYETSIEQTDTLIRQNQSSTEQVLAAIREQVKPPSCPPIPQPVRCSAPAPTSDARANTGPRLDGKLVVGERERLYIIGPGLLYVARIDSGAETSSLDARNIRRFERDGQNWVRFEVPVPNSNGDYVTLEQEIVRNVRILQSNDEEYERRAVVELQFAIGDHQQKAEFTLTDREHLTNNVLIGRNVLRDVMLVDVSKEFIHELPESLLSAEEDNL
ncbi:ATP-dependent zinc protease family protein [Marinobacter zhejiangensis]|uniref:Uncharacterized conserved protein n=1 Tax=Marinobacter zhejiangensis TaxID=488535 RepID=A0A1I4NK40_9GAMM|nr:ATP-dependent zinc protease [Marinobacter zhejiangensis]SFM15677.1 Uncharacterized conserved protein [Marinobacter zhejiangensis]